MSRASAGRDRLIALAFLTLCAALAFWQRPGLATSDTKIDLHVDPGQFLHSVASVWTSTTDLGEVHSAQYSGYLWPMGPFFALLHSIGIGPWVVERLWLTLMLALAAWGMLRLMDTLVGRPRGVVHVVAAAFYVINPYTTVFTARTTITLLGYCALPWLMLVTLYGVRAARGAWRGWRGWWWAAAFGLILTSTGGGVNAAVVGWMLVGPLVVLLYEPATGAVPWRDAWGYLLRVGIIALFACLWWIIPLLVHVRYGIDFLQFTEQPASIWGTNSITESLRLMGYWTSYIGVGFGAVRPFFSDSGTMLFSPFVVGASLLLPALALATLARRRRAGYAPLLALMVVVGIVIMVAGFPDGTPLRGGMLWVYKHVFVLRFMRTTNKAAPLVAVGLAGLLGLGAAGVWTWARRQRAGRLIGIGSGIALSALIVLSALPLFRGDAIDSQLTWKHIPSAWRQAGSELNRGLPANTRALVLPGQIFAYYTWGGTLDAILPRLTTRPVAVRYETPYSDLHAVDLLTTVDDLVQQRRLVPGQLGPLLRLMGVGSVITGSDDDITRSGAIDPAAAAGVLSAQLGTPSHRYGPERTLPPAAGDIGPGVTVPEVRSYAVSGARGLVHVDPTGPATIVDGSASGLADLAAFDGLPATDPLLFAGDESAAFLRSQAAAGANIVITDSNRRRAFLPQSTQQNRGPTLAQNEAAPTNAALLNPFPKPAANGQTVSVLRGARYITSPTLAGELQFPEHAPYAAFDGDPSSSWVADRLRTPADRWIQIGLEHPMNIPYVDVLPLSDAHGTVTEVDVNGVHHAVGGGWTRIPVGLHAASTVRVTIDHVAQPAVGLGGPGGFREIRIPGVHLTQLLRPPVQTALALAGQNLTHDPLSYVFERTTGDDPFLRNPYGTSTVLTDPRSRGDAESALDRLVFAPAARTYRLAAWTYPALGAADPVLDRLAGLGGSTTFSSSGRFENQPAYRASSAFAAGGGAGGAGWVGVWIRPQAPLPWIAFSGRRALTVSHLTLAPSPLPVRRPTSVRISWPGGATGPLTVGSGGAVTLPQPLHTRSLRITVLSAAFAPGTSTRARQAQAVGIGAVHVAGLPAVSVPRSGPLHSVCGLGSVSVGGHVVPLRVGGTVQALDAGRPLFATGCASAPMAAGVQEVRVLPGPLAVNLLELRSPAPAPLAIAAAGTSGGVVTGSGDVGQSSLTGARVALRGPSWVVLGESFDQGWRATCNGRSLGAPVVIDGYANGWRAPAGCRAVGFSFAPQSGASKSYVISALACLLLLGFVLGGARMVRRRAVLVRPSLPDGPIRVRPLPLPAAVALAVPLAVLVGAIFALRAGAVALPLLALGFWRGYTVRALTLTIVGLLGVVVPLLYVIINPKNQGGYNFGYATKLIIAHWVGVAAVVALTLATVALMRAVRAVRSTGTDP